MNFRLLHHGTKKLEPQRITVKSCDVCWPPLLGESSIAQKIAEQERCDFYVVLSISLYILKLEGNNFII